ncbi:exo-beta-D-glucosaminidase [Abditibacteriota bacterium]|nr:exo-beta-D-glucosaminidase [Abditibacteriota bacterium]
MQRKWTQSGLILWAVLLAPALNLAARAEAPDARFGAFPERDTTLLTSQPPSAGARWQMVQSEKAGADGTQISQSGFATRGWQSAIVPGTVLNSLVANGVYPEPYFGLNNAHETSKIPDVSQAGPGFYTYWFRREFAVPTSYRNRRVWLQFDGINYRAEIWLNGRSLGSMAGMFNRGLFDVTDVVKIGSPNALAVLVKPIDVPNGFKAKSDKPSAAGENRNGGDGTIGQYTTMLMTAGWDFTFPDGIRDRNTGIWRDIKLFSTGAVALRNPFVKTQLPLPDTSTARETISVEVSNSTNAPQTGVLLARIDQAKISLQKSVALAPKETRIVTLAPQEFAALAVKNPRLWWPFNKGEQYLYNLSLQFKIGNQTSDQIQTRFGIRQITSDRNTPDQSRIFYINGKRLFLHGSNWVPEAMLRNSPQRTEAELRYTRQSGVNFLRFWAGGVTESDQFFDLCDQLGILVWTEFWQSGDTQIPKDTELYRANFVDTVKRIRNHASLAYYVSANERNANSIVPVKDLLDQLDDTHGWQPGSETDGVHDGSPYKTVNPMWYYEDSASERGSRINGLCPEYGTPILPTIDCLREMMPAQDLWPINKTTWDYLDGGGFHEMSTTYKTAVEQYGPSANIEDFAWKSQMFGALAYRAIWEVWNANRFEYGDRFSSGVLFWYHNSPNRQVCGRMWDWSLEPTAALYFSQNAHQPLHAQYDFLKNTVSVNNELVRAFPGVRVTARVLNMDMSEAYRKTVALDVPADRFVKNVIAVELPTNLSPVHFIRLDIADSTGKSLAQTFYWRSNRDYKPGRTMTGPQYEGFQDLNKLPPVTLQSKVKQTSRNGRNFASVEVSNPSKSLAFMVWLRLQDAATGKPIRPAFYDDNFVSLLPGESRSINIEYAGDIKSAGTKLVVDGWNIAPREFHNGQWKTQSVRPRMVPAALPTEVSNLAKGKTATASSVEIPDRSPNMALDGNEGTRWSSERNDDQWLAIDLGTTQKIGSVQLHWEAAYAQEYKIQTSNDGQVWTDAAHITDGRGGVETRQFAPVTARYIRLLGLKRATEYGYSLWEIGVYGPEVKLTPTMQTTNGNLPDWALGPFVRPASAKPVIEPNPASVFDCPIRKQPVKWEALHTFNPAAIVRNGKIYVLYRAEDDSGEMVIGHHTSRLGLATSEDGIHFTRSPTPVFFPDNDAQKDNEWEGGCEDPRLVESEDGTYVLTYTQWNRQTFRIGVATSKDLEHWTKHGQAFEHAFNGKYANLRYKSSGIVSKLKDGRLIAAKINGKYWMYWGEGTVHLATSTDLINWEPVEDAQGNLVTLFGPRRGKFDSTFPEVGPPPVLTERGIVVLYNGKNAGNGGDPNLGADAYAAGQALFDAQNPAKLIGQLDTPFFKPELPFEMRGQYQSGTTFIEGLVYFKNTWFLYYGCADSLVGVTIHDAA